MHTFEITVQRKYEGHWPVQVRYEESATSLTQWANGVFDLDLKKIETLLPTSEEYGLHLGKNLFHQGEEVHGAFGRALFAANSEAAPLRVLLIIEASDLRHLHWEQLFAPFDADRWDYLLLNQRTPFSLYLPSQIERRFPPIGRRDLRALLLVAGPQDIEGDYGLADFDVPKTITSVRSALGDIPCDVLASGIEGSVGAPSLKNLRAQLTAKHYTLLHIVCHGKYNQDLNQKKGDTILYLPEGSNRRPVSGNDLIKLLERLDQARGLPHFTFLSTCDSAVPHAEHGLGGLAQRLVRDLGMPAVLAMTDRISIQTAQALATDFYKRLADLGHVDSALTGALADLPDRSDVTIPALFSRLGGQALFSDTLDRPLTEAEIDYGIQQLNVLMEQHAPVLLSESGKKLAPLRAILGAEAAALSTKARDERDDALAFANQISNQTFDLSFNALALGQKPPVIDPRCPFRGLLPFRVEDHEFFFGRENLVDKLAGRLEEHNFLGVLGPSGSGKSSLVLAGLVPKLQAKSPLLMVDFRPGSEPLAQMEASLERARSDKGEPDMIVVDQFEEFFTLCQDENQRKEFISRLLSLTQSRQVVIVMRADFWGECARYPGLKEEMQAWQELVAPMNITELRQAMEQQADHVGLRFEAGLGAGILEDVQDEPGAMPLLQHALLQLWQRRHGRWLRWKEYEAIGEIKQAIATTADEVYHELNKDEKERMREIFLRLTRLQTDPAQTEARDTRRKAELAELVPAGQDPAQTVDIIKQLADARLVVTGVNAINGQVEVEMAHEALIRHWPRLRQWLNEDRSNLSLLESVSEAAKDWNENARDNTYLIHRGGRLEDVIELGKLQKYNELEQAYMEACVALQEKERLEKEEQQRRELQALKNLAEEQTARAEEARRSQLRSQRFSIGLLLLFFLAAITSVYAFRMREKAQEQTQIAQTNEIIAQEQREEAQKQALIAQENEIIAQEQREEAQKQARIAQENEKNAQAKLAELFGTQGRLAYENSPLLGLTLVLDGLAIHPSKDPTTEESFRQYLIEMSRLGRVLKYNDSIQNFFPSPDGTMLVVDYLDLPGKLIQLEDGRVVAELVGSIKKDGVSFGSGAASKYFVVQYSKGSPELRFAANGEVVPLGDGIENIYFGPNESVPYLWVDYKDRPGELRQISDLEVISTYPSPLEAVIFSADPDCPYLVINYSGIVTPTLNLLDTGISISDLDPGLVSGFSCSPDVSKRYLTVHYKDDRGRFTESKLYQLGEQDRYSLREGNLAAVSFSHDPASPYFWLKYNDKDKPGELRLTSSGDMAYSPVESAFFSGNPEIPYLIVNRPDSNSELWHLQFGGVLTETLPGSVENIFFTRQALTTTLVIDYKESHGEIRYLPSGRSESLLRTIETIYSGEDSPHIVVAYISENGEVRRSSDAGLVQSLKKHIDSAIFIRAGSYLYLKIVYPNDPVEIWLVDDKPVPLIVMDPMKDYQFIEPNDSMIFIDGKTNRAYRLDLVWLRAMNGQAESLSLETLVNLACEYPIASGLLNQEELKPYLGDRFPQGCPDGN